MQKLVNVSLLVLTIAVVASATQPLVSPFDFDADGWTWVDSRGSSGDVDYVDHGITHEDTSTSPVWWFRSPQAWSGDRSAFYRGELTFKILSVRYSATVAGASKQSIVLIAKCGHHLTLDPLIQTGNHDTNMYSTQLSESSRWVDSRTEAPPTVDDFIGVLAHLREIRIQGGWFLHSQETTKLDGVSIMPSSSPLFPVCTDQGVITPRPSAGSTYFTPSTATFQCEGSAAKTPEVSGVYPRFSRRTGGDIITITGKNLGLAGSNPIAYVNGKACQSTVYTHAAGSVPESVTGPVQEDTLLCKTPPNGLRRDGTVSVSVESISGEDVFASTSCVTEDSRGFAYSGTSPEWMRRIHETSGTNTGLLASKVSIDTNTADIYVTGSLTSGKTYVVTSRVSISCQGTLGTCGVLIKYSKAGVYQWHVTSDATTIGTSTGGFTLTDVGISSSSDGSVYIVGIVSSAAGTSFVPGLFGSTTPSLPVLADGGGISNGGAAAGSHTGLAIGKVSRNGTPTWLNVVWRCTANVGAESFPCPPASQSANERFGATPLVVALPAGGCYVTSSITADGLGGGIDAANVWTRFSLSTDVIHLPPTPTNNDYVRLPSIGNRDASVSVLIKYGSSGNAEWIRSFGAEDTGSAFASSITSTTKALTLLSDSSVALAGSFTCSSITSEAYAYFDTCAWKPRGNVVGSDNKVCNVATRVRANERDASVSGSTSQKSRSNMENNVVAGTASTAFVVAYDSTGVMKWNIDTTRDDAPIPNRVYAGDAWEATAVSFGRLLVGNRALSNDRHLPEGRDQIRIEGAESEGKGFHNGESFIVVGGTFRMQGGSGVKIGKKQLEFPQNAANDDIFLMKIRPSDGSVEWVSYWGLPTQDETVKGLVVNQRTGEISMFGEAVSGPTKGLSSCTSDGSIDCGADVFNVVSQGLEFNPGCMPNPRGKPALTNAEYGQSRCLFASFTDSTASAYVAMLDGSVIDGRGATVVSVPNDATNGAERTARPSITSVKRIGASKSGSLIVTGVAQEATSSGDIVVVGEYSGQVLGTNALIFNTVEDGETTMRGAEQPNQQLSGIGGSYVILFKD